MSAISAALLDVRGLEKRFDGVVAAKNVSLGLARGEMLALIGPNGAGKSTVFNMIGGQLLPDAGRVTLDGANITGMPARRIVRAGVGRTFQIAQTFVSMTVAENVAVALHSLNGQSLRMLSSAARLGRGEAIKLLSIVGMEASADKPIRELAYGDIKRVELAIALAGAPKLLLMDEPTAGMAPAERSVLMGLTRRLARERGVGVLFTEHDMDAVFGFADRILVLVRGEIIAQGHPDLIRDDARVREVYLGDLGSEAAAQARVGARSAP